MKMKKIIIAVVVIVVLLIVAFVLITNGLSEGKNVALDGIDLSVVPDGVYNGTYEHGRWTNTVSVHVENGVITGIDIVDDVFGAKIIDCSEEIFRRVMGTQSTQIDAVAGATVTSKAYLKAIENAIKNIK